MSKLSCVVVFLPIFWFEDIETLVTLIPLLPPPPPEASSQATPLPVEVKTCPSVPCELFTVKFPTSTAPATSNVPATAKLVSNLAEVTASSTILAVDTVLSEGVPIDTSSI